MSLSHVRLSSLLLIHALCLPGFSATAQTQTVSSQIQAAQPIAQATAEGVLRRALAPGLYQLAYSASQQALYVASAESAPGVRGGVIYKLDPQTLETIGLIHTDEKNFGLTVDPSGDTLFITHRRAGSVSKFDLKTGKIAGRVVFSERRPNGSPYGPRAALYDAVDHTLYVAAMGDPGLIWVVDPTSLVVRATITGAGKGVTGLLRDPSSQRLFAATVNGEILVINTQTYTIDQRWQPVGETPVLPLNMALDRTGKRLFVTDNSRLKAVLVLDAHTGALQQQLPVGESLDVQYQAEHNLLVLTHRARGMVSLLDADTYQIQRQYNLPPHPNSLAFSPDDKAVYVSIKTPTGPSPKAPGRYAQGDGSIARIILP